MAKDTTEPIVNEQSEREKDETSVATNETRSDSVVTPPAQQVREQPARASKRGKYLAFALLLLVLSLGAGALGAYFIMRTMPAQSSYINQGASDGNRVITSTEQDIAAVATKVSPSVVSIVTTGEVRSLYGGTQSLEGAGTGIIVSSDGYIITNKHVVQGTQSVAVVASDGTTYENVKVVGTDPLNDVAFLKISGVNNLKAAELGDSSSIRIGQSVVAIGNALGQYDNTVTSGIISGIGRSVTASVDGSNSRDSTETLSDLIQTDAAINPGNSGGPLVNITGQVIGINTAIASDANNLGFTIPINATKGMLKGVLANGKVERPFLGVNYVTITPAVAKEYKLPVKTGAYVHADNNQNPVSAGSPADKAGIKNNDIITKVNDIDVGDKGSVASLVAAYAPGDTVKLTLLRDGKTITVDATLSSYSR